MPQTTNRCRAQSRSPPRPKRIIFIHPDLGIGGAERLVVDAALGLQNKGHEVVIYTAHHDPTHCFEETRDGTLRIVTTGDFLPTSFLGRCHVLCAIVRNLYTALRLGLSRHGRYADIFIADQVSASIPLLQLLCSRAPVLFYCHFPDQLLASGRAASLLKRLYRAPFDWLEEWTTGFAHCILVNSKFTASVFASTFKRLHERGVKPRVLYPSINFSKYDTKNEMSDDGDDDRDGLRAFREQLGPDTSLFLSINRFERKKNIKLCIDAFYKLLEAPLHGNARLVIAGGYDENVRENVDYYRELQQVAERLQREKLYASLRNGRNEEALGQKAWSNFPDMSGSVVFLRSFSERQRSALLRRCVAVLYTPANEHFGIVPVEAMYAERCVIAVNSGGPLESVVHGQTGWLCEPHVSSFASRMRWVLDHRDEAVSMGRRGKVHVQRNFSLQSFSARLDSIVDDLHCNAAKERSPWRRQVLWVGLVGLCVVLFWGALLASR